jgi:peptidoglycan/xylan/chitin deacetylase (PgdA/CDA1 family)
LSTKNTSTGSWLLPPPIRRLRDHLREIRRLAGDTHTQTIDTRRETLEILGALRSQMAAIERVVGQPSETFCRAVVLAYHRVAEPTTDPFELAVTPQQFQEHLEVLLDLGHVVSVTELSSRIRNGTLPDVTFAVTFDDGYADNLHTAKPILERYGVPATVFLATGLLDGTQFWWDELAQLILNDGRPRDQQLTLEIDGESRSWQLQEAARLSIYLDVWELLRRLDDGPRRQALAMVRSQLAGTPGGNDRSLTPEELTELTSGGLIHAGAHTQTHPLLAQIDDGAAFDEITGSKTWLEGCLERAVTAFAYPYGSYGARDVEIVQRAGFEIAFSASGNAVTGGCDQFQVPRVPIGRWNGGDLERTIKRLLRSSPPSMAVSTTPRSGTGGIHFGDLRRLTPISREWGFDRGKPIDRHYIERFLQDRSGAIRGHVLEVGEPLYTQMYGGDQVAESDVLDVMGTAGAKYTCRLEDGDELPGNTFDCIICTQVLQYIHDVSGAIRTLHRVLKPGGSLLLTVPCITPIHAGDQYGDAWHWCFTVASTSRLCAELFGHDALQIEAFGNVFAATAFLYGLADSELTREELDHFDPDYAIVIGAGVTKAHRLSA